MKVKATLQCLLESSYFGKGFRSIRKAIGWKQTGTRRLWYANEFLALNPEHLLQEFFATLRSFKKYLYREGGVSKNKKFAFWQPLNKVVVDEIKIFEKAEASAREKITE